MRNGSSLRPPAVASFVRGEVARALRSRKPYNVNLLLGGVDPITNEPSLYWIDYLAALAKVPYAAHGYAQYVTKLTICIPPCQDILCKVTNRCVQILLPLPSRQTPPPRHRPREGPATTPNVHRRVEETVADRFQGCAGQGRDERRSSDHGSRERQDDIPSIG